LIYDIDRMKRQLLYEDNSPYSNYDNEVDEEQQDQQDQQGQVQPQDGAQAIYMNETFLKSYILDRIDGYIGKVENLIKILDEENINRASKLYLKNQLTILESMRISLFQLQPSVVKVGLDDFEENFPKFLEFIKGEMEILMKDKYGGREVVTS
jgi:hypothetical protein